MTFSLRPARRSTLPLMAASVRTFVVSWNDAAEMKLSVESDAFVMPSRSGSAIAGWPLLLEDALVLLVEAPLLDLIADQELGVADLLDADAAEHLPHDHFDVLVVDAHALESVDLLHLVDQVLRERLLAEDREDVVRVRAAVHERLAGLHEVALVHADVLALGDQVLARLADLGRDDDLALALRVLAERHDAVDLGDDGELLRLPRLEQLGDARQTAGDVLRLRRLARDLRDDVARAATSCPSTTFKCAPTGIR